MNRFFLYTKTKKMNLLVYSLIIYIDILIKKPF
nr:MAG TPA: hypothetical protein [Caudoviricetes sp.]